MVYRVFVRDAGAFVIVRLSHTVVQQAAGLLLTAPAPVRLRSLDALHVASARWSFARARRSGLAVGAFVTSDRALAVAAGWVGLSVENPEDDP